MSVDISSTTGRHTREVRTESYPVETSFGPATVLRLYPPATDYLDREIHTNEVVFSAGWGESINTTRQFGEAMARAGFSTTMYDYPAFMPPKHVQESRDEVTAAVLDSLDGTIDLIGHSEGFFQTIRAAAVRKDIGAALGAAPAGISGTLTVGELVRCAFTEGKEAVAGTRHNTLGMMALGRAFFGLARNVGSRPQLSRAEVSSIATTDALPNLERAMSNGVRLGILACKYDNLFPDERIRTHLDGRQFLIDMYEVLDTNHFHFLSRQEVATLVIDRAQQLFKRSAR